MANKLERVQVDFNGKEVTCAKFTIEDTTIPFVLKKIMTTGEEYTFSLYIKSDSSSSIIVAEKDIESPMEWKHSYVQFTAAEDNLEIVFGKTGTYYLYNSQLEKGKVCTEWTPDPDDTEENVKEIGSIANQTADKFSWLIKSGTGETSLEVTDGLVKALTEKFVVSSPSGETIIEGGELKTKAITAEMIDVDDIFSKNINATGKITGVELQGAKGTIGGWKIEQNSLSSQIDEVYIALQADSKKLISCYVAGKKEESNSGSFSVQFGSFLNEDLNTLINNGAIIDATSWYKCDTEKGYFRMYATPAYIKISKYISDGEKNILKNALSLQDGKIRLSRDGKSITFYPDMMRTDDSSICFNSLSRMVAGVVAHYWGNSSVQCTTTNNSYINVPAFTTTDASSTVNFYEKSSDNQIKILRKGLYLFQVRLATKSSTANKRCIFAPFINGNQVTAYAITPYSPAVAVYTRLESFTISLDANDTVDFRASAMEKVVCELQIQDIYVHVLDYDKKYA